MLALFYLACDREPPEGAERVAKVGVWAQALQDVPVAQIVPLAHAELRERESAFFPAPADLLRRFNEGAHFSPEGATNTAAYLPYSPSNARVLPPSPDVPLQIEPQELKRRLGLVRDESASTTTAPQGDDLAEVGERWSAFLLDIARAGNIDLDLCSPAQIAELRAFGRWWLAHHPQRDLLTTGFGSAYGVFHQQKGFLNTENTEELERHRRDF